MYSTLKSIFDARFSCRTFQSDFLVPDEDVAKIVDSAYLGPSSLALWPFEIIVVSDKDTIRKVATSIHQHSFIGDSSVLIFVAQRRTVQRENGYGQHYIDSNEGHIDAAIAGTYIDLTATSLGYNTIWMGCYENQKIIDILAVPKDLQVLYYIAIGKTTTLNSKRPDFMKKKNVKDKVHFLQYGKKYYDA